MASRVFRYCLSCSMCLIALLLSINVQARPNRTFQTESANGNGEESAISVQTVIDAASDALNPDDVSVKCGGMECIDLVPLLDDVYYTVTESMTLRKQLTQWGVAAKDILMLNKGLELNTVLKVGQKVHVQSRTASTPEPYSSGPCNRGRIRNARLMPEGEGYFLRNVRKNSWGVDTTIQALMTAFHAYHEAYPDGPKINVGDLSRRKGGRLKPHKSHQSGRDVDLGYIHTPSTQLKSKQRFTRANPANMDAEKTWFFVKSLIQTGKVQKIFIDKNLQIALWNAAKDEITPEQRDLIFSWPHRETSSRAILQFWPGHVNHMHVRFRCPSGQFRCRK